MLIRILPLPQHSTSKGTFNIKETKTAAKVTIAAKIHSYTIASIMFDVTL